MSDIQKIDNIRSFTAEDIKIIRSTIVPGLNDNQLKLFLSVVQRTQLDPFARQIYAFASGDRLNIQTSIDGFRLIAQRSGEYRGQTEPQWCGADGIWKNVWTEKEQPVAARVGVYREGFAQPVYAVANYSFYAQESKNGRKNIWDKGGYFMLAKCAEALALRKAFPQELSGIYTDDEMHQAAQPEKNIESNVQEDPEKAQKIDFGKKWKASEYKTVLESVYGQGPEGLRAGYEVYKTQPGFAEFEAITLEKAVQ